MEQLERYTKCEKPTTAMLIENENVRKSTIQFFKDMGRRLAVRFQDQRECDFLLQSVFGYSQGERLQHFAVVP